METENIQINEQIRDREVRVISADGEQLGIMSSKEALALAEEAELDLVKIAPTAKPPVCKIVDYGKYKYDQMRKEKESKKKQHVVETKEIRMSPNIDTNDIKTKISAARKFLEKGNKVKITVKFRGREIAYTKAGETVLNNFVEELSEISSAQSSPKLEGKFLSVMLLPGSKIKEDAVS